MRGDSRSRGARIVRAFAMFVLAATLAGEARAGGWGTGAEPRDGAAAPERAQLAQYRDYPYPRRHRHGLFGLFSFPGHDAAPDDVRPWWLYYPPQPAWDGRRLIWIAPRFPPVACSDYLPPYDPGACPH
jgi:hypothetical protein